MKLERLYAITMYLLDHGKTPASELARHFEVSLRTIQRDMDSLCLAGIPVISTSGSAGGYEISDRFRLDGGYATSEDHANILTALRGLASATKDPKVQQTLEKLSHFSGEDGRGIILDFSVLQESDQETLQRLQAAVAKKCRVVFSYTDNDLETREHCVEPIAVLYRWYAWYLFAYSTARADHRLYKLVRMSGLRLTDEPFTKEHAPAEVLLREMDQRDARRYVEIQIRCSASARPRIREYLKGTVIQEYDNGDVLMRASVVENEQLWIGTLLSLGDQVEVTAPEDIRMRLLGVAKKIVSLYEKE